MVTVVRREPFSYRNDSSVPAWDESHGLIVFDGECVLCSGFVQWVIRNDPGGYFRFTTGQSELGQALYKHYGLNPTDFESNLVITDGRLYTEARTVAEVGRRLGGKWRLLSAFDLVPGPLRAFGYDRIAKNRFTLFGRRDTCLMPSALNGRHVE
jgi:predicted DCC family thiol-disulfide oxidoreductase YuxK